MPIGYDIGTGLYHLGIRAASLFVPKAALWVKGRRDLWKRLKQKAPQIRGCLWMHCASLGEFEQGRPVLEALKKARPDLPILLTFYSPSGYEMIKADPIATHVEYLPPDSKANADRLISLIQPSAAIFVKYEFWYHHLHSLARRKVPAFLISANFRSDQAFFKWYGGTYRKMLGFFDRIFVQDERSADLLRSIGKSNVSVSGDTRADRVMAIVERNEELPLAREFRERADGPVVVFGSTWPGDEKVILSAFEKLKEKPTSIEVPHELNSDHLARLRSEFPLPVSSWSEGKLKENSRTLLIDEMGLLARIYRYGDVAYIGGGFSDGIHNLLEPAAWGLPVIFGPDHKKFNEAKGLIDAGAGFEVKNKEELARILDRLLGDEAFRTKAGNAAAEYVRSRSGATEKICKSILQMI